MQIFGDGFDRARCRLYLLEGFEQSFLSKRPHRRGSCRHVKETIKVAWTNSEQTSKIVKCHSLGGVSFKAPERFLKLLARETASRGRMEKIGSTGGSEAYSRLLRLGMDPLLELGQRPATTTQRGGTTIQYDLLPRMGGQGVIHLKRAGRHHQPGLGLSLDFEAVRRIQADEEQCWAFRPFQTLILQPARGTVGRGSARAE